MFDPIQCEFDVAARMGRHLTGIEIVSEDPPEMTPESVIENPIQKAIAAAATGAAAIVMTPELSGTSKSKPLFFDSVTVDIVVFCANMLNASPLGAKQRAFIIAGQIGAILHGFASPGWYGEFEVVSVNSVRIGNLPKSITDILNGETIQSAAVRVRTQMEQPVPAKCDVPTMSCTALNVPLAVTITAPAGCTLLYTVGAGAPATAAASAAVVNITSPGYLRAAAVRADYQDSDTVTAEFTA